MFSRRSFISQLGTTAALAATTPDLYAVQNNLEINSMKTHEKAAMPGFESAYATLNNVRLHYWVGGNPNGQPILLWHGFLGTSYTWHKMMPLLAEAGFAVLAPDMRGYGDSDKPAGKDGYDARALAEEFRSLVKHLNFGAGKPLVLVGYDMGGPPALLWAADHPDEVRALLYIDVPVMLSEILTKVIAYTPEAMTKGSLWWWILPLAPEVPERLIVGKERDFLNWFYDNKSAIQGAVSSASVDEFLRTFSGREGVLGSMGVYRAAFTTMEQTAALKTAKVQVPVIAIGGSNSRGDQIREMISLVAANVSGVVIPNCGHFVPEEHPQELFEQIEASLAIARTT
jgi:pimeloyl-ACP methyl ester carboxylesterase